MANTGDDPGGTITPLRFVSISEGNVSVRWQALFGAIFGGAFLAFFEGVISNILTAADVTADLLAGLAEFNAALVDTVVGIPTKLIRGAFEAAAVDIPEFGAGAWLAALVVTLLTLYVVAEVRDRV
jgi:hypothetical protein